jgi:hypothetical protein
MVWAKRAPGTCSTSFATREGICPARREPLDWLREVAHRWQSVRDMLRAHLSIAEPRDAMSCEIALHMAMSPSSGNRPEFIGRRGIVVKMPTGARQVGPRHFRTGGNHYSIVSFRDLNHENPIGSVFESFKRPTKEMLFDSV